MRGTLAPLICLAVLSREAEMTRKPTPEEEQDLAAYLSRLERHLDSLQRFPRSSYTQAVIFGASLVILFTGFIGLVSVPVPLYLIVPFAVMPGWTLVRHELKWRDEYQKTKTQIKRIEGKQAG